MCRAFTWSLYCLPLVEHSRTENAHNQTNLYSRAFDKTSGGSELHRFICWEKLSITPPLVKHSHQIRFLLCTSGAFCKGKCSRPNPDIVWSFCRKPNGFGSFRQCHTSRAETSLDKQVIKRSNFNRLKSIIHAFECSVIGKLIFD